MPDVSYSTIQDSSLALAQEREGLACDPQASPSLSCVRVVHFVLSSWDDYSKVEDWRSIQEGRFEIRVLILCTVAHLQPRACVLRRAPPKIVGGEISGGCGNYLIAQLRCISASRTLRSRSLPSRPVINGSSSRKK